MTARQDQTEGKKKKAKKIKEKDRAPTQISIDQTSISISSWWGKDDTRDRGKAEIEGQK